MEETAHNSAEHTFEPEAAFPPGPDASEAMDGASDGASDNNGDLAAKVATIAVVGVGVALISAELIPGMLLGVAASFLPGVRGKVKPFFKHTVRAGYAAVRKTREVMAEAGEQFQDIVAEAKSEKIVTPPASKA
jgi:hypothetical protein